jgi:hypothetical protein
MMADPKLANAMSASQGAKKKSYRLLLQGA